LFLDLKGYTSMAEREAPEETVRTLNAFFETMSDWVHQCGGFVDKFVGDAMLVCFGLFDPGQGSAVRGTGDHAAAAVEAAAGIRGRLQELNAVRVADDRPELSVGIGVHTGEVVAGIVGARDRHEYTVIGDAVNIAARLQEACRDRGVDVLVSQSVCEALGTDSRAANLSALGSMKIRGRSGTLDVYTIPESA
jgi:adenylate cyclase